MLRLVGWSSLVFCVRWAPAKASVFLDWQWQTLATHGLEMKRGFSMMILSILLWRGAWDRKIGLGGIGIQGEPAG